MDKFHLILYICFAVLIFDIAVVLYIRNTYFLIFKDNYRDISDKLGKPDAVLDASLVNINFLLVKFNTAVSVELYKDLVVFRNGTGAICVKDFSSLELSGELLSNVKINTSGRAIRVYFNAGQYKIMQKYLEEHNV